MSVRKGLHSAWIARDLWNVRDTTVSVSDTGRGGLSHVGAG